MVEALSEPRSRPPGEPGAGRQHRSAGGRSEPSAQPRPALRRPGGRSAQSGSGPQCRPRAAFGRAVSRARDSSRGQSLRCRAVSLISAGPVRTHPARGRGGQGGRRGRGSGARSGACDGRCRRRPRLCRGLLRGRSACRRPGVARPAAAELRAHPAAGAGWPGHAARPHPLAGTDRSVPRQHPLAPGGAAQRPLPPCHPHREAAGRVRGGIDQMRSRSDSRAAHPRR